MEKTVITFLKSGSAVIYVLILCLVLSIPVIFIYQAFMPPSFTFDSVSVDEGFSGDEVISENAGDWNKLQLSFTATAGKFSPYRFEIREFKLEGTEKEHKIFLDDTVRCTKDENDPFTLTVYIKGAEDINALIKELSFKASDYTKSFGEFDLKFEDGKAKPFKK